MSFLLLAACPGCGVKIAAAAPPAIEDVSALLEPIRAEHQLPGLAGSIVAQGRTIAIGATGVRARGESDLVALDDRWHLGSCTKAMTATLVALLVEEGRLSWTTTLGEIFPEETSNQRAWRAVTIEQLLQHRSGLPPDSQRRIAAWSDLPADGPLPRQRRNVVGKALAFEPEAVPGSRMQYANLGYVVAGSLLEVRAGMSWESLMRQRLFEPLGMSSAGFGPPRPLPQPQGHREGKALGTGPGADNPPVIGPAGTVHATLQDWGKFVALHLAGSAGKSPLLARRSFTRMHTPAPGGTYALGWVAASRAWGGNVITHAGSNGYWYSVVWAAPERGFAVLVATNEGGDRAAAATDAAAGALIRHYLANEKKR